MARWLVELSPDEWPAAQFLGDRAADQRGPLPMTRYLDVITEGDEVALWLTGPKGGVVVLGVVADPGEMEQVQASKPRTDHQGFRGEASAIPFELLDVFFDTPITWKELGRDTRFSQAGICRDSEAGNPLPLTEDEWAAIVDLRPTGSPPITSSSMLRAGWWVLQPGDTIRRRELHDRYGGSRQDGISQSRVSPNVFIFTDPRRGEQHGYYDTWVRMGAFTTQDAGSVATRR